MNKQLRSSNYTEDKSQSFKEICTGQSIFFGKKHPNIHDYSNLKLIHFDQNDNPICLC